MALTTEIIDTHTISLEISGLPVSDGDVEVFGALLDNRAVKLLMLRGNWELPYSSISAADTRILNLIQYAPVPVIAVISGECSDAGIEFAFSSHFRIVSEETQLVISPSRKTLSGFTNTEYIRRYFSGCRTAVIPGPGKLSALEAFETGLVNQVTSRMSLIQESIKCARILTGKLDSEVVRAAVRSINNGLLMNDRQAYHEETGIFSRLAQHYVPN